MKSGFLKTNRLFKDMEESEIDLALAAFNASYKSYEKGENILHAGDRVSSVCIVVSGSVSIEINDAWGRRTILNLMEANDFFAESYAIMQEETLLVDAVANERAEILFLYIGDLFEAAAFQPWQVKFIRNLLMITARKNLMLSGRTFFISPKTVRGRIMAYLTYVSLKKQRNMFDIPFDRQQLADHLNLDRTALSKELGRMKRDGIIDFQKNHFKLIRQEIKYDMFK